MKPRLFWSFFVILHGFVFTTPLCFADGYITVVQSVGKLPGIPMQRAIIEYRNGVEKLAIETTFEKFGNDFGWIVPLPSVPTRFQSVSLNLFDALSIQTRPTIGRIADVLFVPPIIFLVYAAVVVLKVVLKLKNPSKGTLVAIPIIGIVFLIFIFPNFVSYERRGGGRSSYTAGIQVVSSHTVGRYDISVIKADDSAKLNQWLADNHFVTIPADAIAVVETYIANDWCFVTAKLASTAQEQFARTHPVLMEFRTANPVYPMRLTSFSESDVSLELFISADRQVAPIDYDLKKIFCGRIHLWKKEKDHQTISHVDADKAMWNGSILTRLSGVVQRSAMKKDMYFAIPKQEIPEKPFRATIWRYESGLFFPYSCAIIGAVIVVILLRPNWGHITFVGTSMRVLFWLIPPVLFFASAATSKLIEIKLEQTQPTYTVRQDCGEDAINTELKNMYTAMMAYFSDYPNAFPSHAAIRNYGFRKQSTCVDLFVDGSRREDFTITGMSLAGDVLACTADGGIAPSQQGPSLTSSLFK